MRNTIFPCTKEYVKKLDDLCRKASAECPGFLLQLNQSCKSTYRVYDEAKGTRKYIATSDKRFLILVRKYCATRILRVLSNTAWRNHRATPKTFEALDEISLRLEEAFGEFTPSFVRSRKSIIQKWVSESYERNPYFPINAEGFRTERGEYVRSKTECMIADYLFEHNIPYKLEAPLMVCGREVYPDFTIVNPINGEVFYIESFGMMQDPEYALKCVRKIQEYAREGYTVGDSLLVCFECEERPFDPDGFKKMIKNAMGV